MNAKFLRPLAAILVVTSLSHSAIAETLGDHPAVLVARTWSTRGIDPNTFIVQHPAGHVWLDAAPAARQEKAAGHAPAPGAVKTPGASNK
jgi:hypothetical protein